MTFDILKMSKDGKRHTKRLTPEEDEAIMKEVEAQGDSKKALSILEQKFAGQHPGELYLTDIRNTLIRTCRHGPEQKTNFFMHVSRCMEPIGRALLHTL